MRTLAILCIVSASALFIIILFRLLDKKEAFGTSPGTMVQLASSHVPTEEDAEELRGYARQVNHDLIDMTGAGL